MRTIITLITTCISIALGLILFNKRDQVPPMLDASNPVVYFEIPVKNMDRAINFYRGVFGFDFTREVIDGNEMALFPFEKGGVGISGALAKGSVYRPTTSGVIIYFTTSDIAKTLSAAVDHGGKIVYPITSNGDLGSVAEFQDTEGNRIALHSAARR